MWLIEEVKAQPERKRISKALKDGLPVFGFLSLECRKQPTRAEEKPQRVNPSARRGEIHISHQGAAALKMAHADWKCNHKVGEAV
jgi:hypothetical protein